MRLSRSVFFVYNVYMNTNETLTHQNYKTYSDGMQLCLPLDLSISIDKDDPMWSFLDAVEGVNFSKYVKLIRSNNTHSHDRGMLLKTFLFAFMEGHRSLSEIAHLCKVDTRYLYLSNQEKPSFMAFQRMTQDLTESIDDIFFDISQHIAQDLMLCDTDIQYIDGTKIEANAHKNSFVYKRRILNAEERLFPRISESIFQLNFHHGYDYPVKQTYAALEMGYICQYLMEIMVKNNIEIKYGTGQRKSEIQREYDTFLGYYEKLMEYEYWLSIMGKRNSCSKIDLDATFMATKWDYYNQSGVTRACYNCQIAVSDGIIVNSNVYQSVGDTLTWQDFIERYKERTGNYPKWPVADAGYGSYDNYFFNIIRGIELVQKYNMYGKKEDKRFQKNIYNALNWKENEEGYKICPCGRVFDQYSRDKYRNTLQNNLMITQLYNEKDQCRDCKNIKECTKGKYRQVGRNVVMEEFQKEVDKNLSTEKGKEMKKQRSIQVEGAFGVIKQDFKFTRFSRRGMKNVKMEFLLVCLGYNLKKYHIFRQKHNVQNLQS